MKQTNIHVVYIITKLELGGAQKITLSLFNGLCELGIATKLFSGKQGPLVASVENSPDAILLNSLTREVSFFSAVHELRCFFSLIQHLRALKKKHPNIMVHTHSTKAGILGRWAAFFAGIKRRVHTVHGYGFHDHQNKFAWWIIYLAERITSTITTHYICVSSHDAQVGLALFPNFEKKHSIIRAAVDWEEFYTPARVTTNFPDQNNFTFGTVACFKPQKNLFDLLEAFKYVHLRNTQTRLEIVGDGILRPEIEAWIARNQLTSAITLHGWQARVAPIMFNWNAFVLSSLWEGLPCSIVEARLLKIPVLSYDTGGIRDVISHGKNGFLYPQKDWQTLAQGMLELSNNQQLYTQLQTHGDDLHDFNNKEMLLQHAELYKMLQ